MSRPGPCAPRRGRRAVGVLAGDSAGSGEEVLAAALAREPAGLRVAMREAAAGRDRRPAGSGAAVGAALPDGGASRSREPRAASAWRSLSASPSSSSRWVWICWRSWSSMLWRVLTLLWGAEIVATASSRALLSSAGRFRTIANRRGLSRPPRTHSEQAGRGRAREAGFPETTPPRRARRADHRTPRANLGGRGTRACSRRRSASCAPAGSTFPPWRSASSSCTDTRSSGSMTTAG